MKRNSQSGVALVITLILLSVITFMAVTFLVVSRHEGAQVNTITQQANAKFAAEAALEQAKAQMIAQMIVNNSGYNFGLVVSTNYVSAFYDNSSLAVSTNLGNVAYNYANGTTNLAQADQLQMLNNLLILPRPPVFLVTNKAFPNNSEFRFWHDLNRNGIYDTNGSVLEVDATGTPILDPINNKQQFFTHIGDPEWIGVLNRPDFRHSSSNFFVARYCFIALPIGNSLDINYIHNQSLQDPHSTLSLADLGFEDGYLRNQGVGSWEINLAAFLNGLNPNVWPTNQYLYLRPVGSVNRGQAFDDAASIIQYRYNKNYNNLATFTAMFGPAAANRFTNDFIDGYSYGPLMTTIFPLTTDGDINLVNNKGWSGADNPSNFFTTQDLFGNIPSPAGSPTNSFTNRLYLAGKSLATADRYTYYNLLSQMSFGSAAESSPAGYPSPKLNLNYQNVGGVSATNFLPWTNALQFFTNAANLLLANAGYTNTVANIPIYPTNIYTPALHRLLQLAANIYDASRDNTTNVPSDFDFPNVFRPIFNRNGSNVFINGYVEETNNVTSYFIQPLSLPEDLLLVDSSTTNIYGIPWVIGAKKGFPNFNEISMQSVSLITRRVQIVKQKQTDPPANWSTNIQYVVGISNTIGVEAWNSYNVPYARAVDIIGVVNTGMYLTNELGPLYATNFITPPLGLPFKQSIAANQWSAFNAAAKNQANNKASFQIPLLTNIVLMTNLVYHPNVSPRFNGDLTFDPNLNYIQPNFGLNITNRLRFVMVDHASGRVIDYVHFNGMDVHRDLTAELPGPPSNYGDDGGIWDTNRVSGLNSAIYGVNNQMQICMGNNNIANYQPFTAADWVNDQLSSSSQINGVRGFTNFYYGGDTNLIKQLPFTPTRKVTVYYTWQANDPLVHYTLGDLTSLPRSILTNWGGPIDNTNGSLPNIQLVNTRYMPWGNLGNGNPDTNSTFNPTTDITVKDPLIAQSSDWQFPTNKFPNIGWLGRVHRGTPWQTIYLKSTPVSNITNWQRWSGNPYVNNFGGKVGDPIYGSNVVDAVLTQPINDWRILDLFTTAPNENASHGQLSINQTNLAAWAAILDGVFVITNSTIAGTNTLVGTYIDPGQSFLAPGTNYFTNTVQYLVGQINSVRSSTNATGAFNYPGAAFSNLGQILAVPELTVSSPYLNLAGNTNLLNDVAYERIPQQILSLLRVGTPRYVIFAYGQSLKPADHSIVQSGPFFGMCTNYQITGEMATRTVIRFDDYPSPGQTKGPHAVVESFNVLPPE